MRLLDGDCFSSVPQKCRMVNTDRRHNRNVRIDGIHGIEPAAQADFEDHHVWMRILKKFEHREAGVFEVRERHAASCGLHFAKGSDQRLVRDFLPIEERALIEANEVRRRMHGRTKPCLAPNALHNGAGGPFAVRTGNCDDGTFKLNPHAGDHRLHALQPHIDGLIVELFNEIEPLIKRSAGSRRLMRRRNRDYGDSHSSEIQLIEKTIKTRAADACPCQRNLPHRQPYPASANV